MAGDWIKMRADLHTHPKVVRIASALKADRLLIVGGLHAVWCLFDMHSEDGMLSGYTTKTVDELIGCNGFASAMCAVKWLVSEADGLSLPEFDEHNGQSAKRRATETKRKREERVEGASASARKPSASNAEKKRSREEKRREETSSSLRSEDVTPATPGEVCKAMRQAGMADVSPSHPKLISLLAAGLTQAELVDAAIVAVAGKKPFSYALATAEGRRRDAVTSPLPSTPRLNPQEALEAANRAVGERFLAEQEAARATH